MPLDPACKNVLKVLLVLPVLVTVMTATYMVTHRDTVFAADDELVIYGRDRCAHTTRLREELEQSDIPFLYADIDKTFVEVEMWVKLGALTGKATRAQLPVVEINGLVMQRPSLEDTLEQYSAAATQTFD